MHIVWFIFDLRSEQFSLFFFTSSLLHLNFFPSFFLSPQQFLNPISELLCRGVGVVRLIRCKFPQSFKKLGRSLELLADERREHLVNIASYSRMGSSKSFKALLQSWRESKRDSQDHDRNDSTKKQSMQHLTSWLQNQRHKLLQKEPASPSSSIPSHGAADGTLLLGNNGDERLQEQTDTVTRGNWHESR
jgi:hypothetical protein